MPDLSGGEGSQAKLLGGTKMAQWRTGRWEEVSPMKRKVRTAPNGNG